MGKEFKIKRGDTLPQMRCEITTQAGAFSLADVASVKILLKRGATVKNRTGTIVSPATAGIVSYDFVAGDWDVDELEPGSYSIEFQLTYTAGGKLTAPTAGFGSLIVEGDLGD